MSNQLADAAAACCSPLASEPLSPQQAEVLAKAFKALGDPVRLRLLSLIAAQSGRDVCVCDLTSVFEVTQPTISHHLKVLREAGLITGERRGTWVYYQAEPQILAYLSRVLETGELAVPVPAAAALAP
jgi:ArsR family transcriptional regulator